MSPIERTVAELKLMATATRLATIILSEGLIQEAILIRPRTLNKDEVIWPKPTKKRR